MTKQLYLELLFLYPKAGEKLPIQRESLPITSALNQVKFVSQLKTK